MRMTLSENAQMAIKTLRENKMRSFLTVLGVVIGITALLAVVSILMGVYSDVDAYLSDYGRDTLFVFRFDLGIHPGRLTQEDDGTWPVAQSSSPGSRRLTSASRSWSPGSSRRRGKRASRWRIQPGMWQQNRVLVPRWSWPAAPRVPEESDRGACRGAR